MQEVEHTMANSYSTHTETLEALAGQRDAEIAQSVRVLQERDKTAMALRAALKAGISIDEISANVGLSPEEIRQRVSAPDHVSV